MSHVDEMALILGGIRGPIRMKLFGVLELTLKLYSVIDICSEVKPKIGLPYNISVLFEYKILPHD